MRIISLTASVLLMIAMAVDGGILMVTAALVVFLLYRYWIVPAFQGLSGDLAGWFVQTAEIWMLAALCFGQFAEGLL